MWTALVLLILLTPGSTAETYASPLNGVLFRLCPSGQVVSNIQSSYNDDGKDRQWKITCRPFEVLSKCEWSGFFELHQQELKFNCPADHVINAMYSIYDPDTEDRTWNFHCCGSPNLITFDCRETAKVNYFKENFNWTVPGGNVLTGASTHVKNEDGDHRWSYSYCRAVKTDSETSTSDIFAANTLTADALTDGDIVPTTKTSRVCTNCSWSKGEELPEVPYTISPDFSSSQKTIIETAMNEFHLSTCVRFVPHKSQSDYIDIVKKKGCSSVIGRKGGMQELSLGIGCVEKGIVQHELMHALGFWHEHNRSDRDVYVKIMYENINSSYLSNFDRLDTENLNVPYDYSSLMHYGRKDFSKNGEDTVVPFVTTASIGQRIEMSDNDILKINKLYGCKNYLHKNGEWDSELEQTFTRQCPEGQAVSGITSAYNSQKKDRHWGVTCKAFVSTHICSWSNFANDDREDIAFECGDDRVLAGVHSIYSHTTQDRKWKFSCCKASFSLFNCNSDPFVNYYGEYFSWKVAGGNFIKGVKSIFDANTGDRRWKFSYCQRDVE